MVCRVHTMWLLTWFLLLSMNSLQAEQMLASSQLKGLTLEELLEMEVTTARKPQELAATPGAVAVLSSDRIRRSGATTIPDVLRLAPEIHVVRSDGRSWGISARGLNLNTANKLQVLMDGRIVYTPLFGGVFWDVQDYILQDLDRIEIIRGPGATLWGGNAVNGVINIKTLPAHKTQGGLLEGGLGNEERAFINARYGSKWGEKTFYRGYFRFFDRDSLVLANGESAEDDWRMGHGGFRVDRDLSPGSSLTVQGDVYRGKESFIDRDDGAVSGGNLLGRYERLFEGKSDLILVLYYDRSDRKIPRQFQEKRNTFDIDLQHRFQKWGRHDLVWGFNYRGSSDETEDIGTVRFFPRDRTIHHFSGFLQDDITLVPERLTLIAGTKVEDNTFSGLELQPNIRIAWTPRARHLLWGSIARAVRVPARLDTDFRFFPLPGVLTIEGNPDYKPEEVIGVEGGYRVSIRPGFATDFTLFHHSYDSLTTLEPGETPVSPAIIGNGLNAKITGLTVAAAYEPFGWLRTGGAVTFLHKTLELDSNSRDLSNAVAAGNDPDYYWNFHVMFDPSDQFEADLILRSSGELPAPVVPGYVTMDLRFGWWVSESLELSITGQNLLHDSHPEFGAPGPTREEVERGVYGKVTWFF